MLFFSFFFKKETRRNKNRGPLFGCYLVFVIFDGRVNIETFTDFSFQFPEGLPQFRNIIPQIGEVTRLGNLAEKIGEFTMMMIPFCLVVRGGGESIVGSFALLFLTKSLYLEQRRSIGSKAKLCRTVVPSTCCSPFVV